MYQNHSNIATYLIRLLSEKENYWKIIGLPLDEDWFLKVYVNLLMILNALAIESILFLIFNIFNRLPETWYMCVCVEQNIIA